MLNPSSLRSKLQRTLQLDISFGSGANSTNVNFSNTENKKFSSDCEKAKILQEARCFSSTTVQVKQCCSVITKICFLLSTGEPLTSEEATSLFFGVTRLFQNNNDQLRRMVYLLLKELPVSTAEAFIVTSCLTKDTTSHCDLHRANAVRVLSRIADGCIAGQIERYLKTAIVDKSPFVSSCALVSALNFYKCAPDIVKRWSNEIQGCISNSTYPMVQAHAIIVLHELKSSDRLAQRKHLCELLTLNSSKQMSHGGFNTGGYGTRAYSLYTDCILITYAAESLRTEGDYNVHEQLFKYVESCTRHRDEMVIFHAVKTILLLCYEAITGSSNPSSNMNTSCTSSTHSDNMRVFKGYMPLLQYDPNSALHILQGFLSSPKPVVRFAAVRILNKLTQSPTNSVLFQSTCKMACGDVLESLLMDPNRAIATLALTSLLKTGNESNVERLMKQISSLINEISDAFKLDIVKAVLQLALAFPNKHRCVVSFLSSSLREEGGLDIKSATCEALIQIVQNIPAAHESGLLHLCEFIEDCEFPSVCCRVLDVLGSEAPKSMNAAKFIRFIYNRLILEKAIVRLSGIDALCKIAMCCPNLRGDILALLEGCLNDSDDEVRERDELYVAALKKSLYGSNMSDKSHENMHDNTSQHSTCVPSSPRVLKDLLETVSEPEFSIDALCDALQDHLIHDENKEFLFNNLPTEAAYQQKQMNASTDPSGMKSSLATHDDTVQGKMQLQAYMHDNRHDFSSNVPHPYIDADILHQVEPILNGESMGPFSHTSKVICLTEEEAEYRVDMFIHIFEGSIDILQFNVTNTVEGQQLGNVHVFLTPIQGQWILMGAISIPTLLYGETKSCFVVLKSQSTEFMGDNASFSAILKYSVMESGDFAEYYDEYPIEPVALTTAAFIAPKPLRTGEFQTIWNSLEDEANEGIAKLSLPFKTIADATVKILSSLNMAPCDKTDTVDPTKASHCLLASGTFVGNYQVLTKVQFLMSAEHGCIMKLASRSDHPALGPMIAGIFD